VVTITALKKAINDSQAQKGIYSNNSSTEILYVLESSTLFGIFLPLEEIFKSTIFNIYQVGSWISYVNSSR
jgi:hypothetical protein